MEDLRRLYADLSRKTAEALERHLQSLTRPEDPERRKEFDFLALQLRDEGSLSVTVEGADGEQIAAGSLEGLDAGTVPERIDWVTFDSAALLRRHNITPLNRFSLRLDFTEPPSFDTYNPWEQPTPNTSNLEIIGSDATWVTGVHEATLSFFRKRRRRRAWLHTQHWFSALNWLLGFPAALWVIFRLDDYFPALRGSHGVLRGALYVYAFLVALAVFRLGVWTFRWMFPVVELEGARSNKARTIIGTIISSIILGFAYDVVRTLLW